MSEIWNLSTICRCCHSDGNFRSLREPYAVGDDIEIYESMLKDVFSIAIFQMTTTMFEASYTICEECIQKLKNAVRFKQQVLECEEKFNLYCRNELFIPPHIIENVVKTEPVDSTKDEFDKEYIITHVYPKGVGSGALRCAHTSPKYFGPNVIDGEPISEEDYNNIEDEEKNVANIKNEFIIEADIEMPSDDDIENHFDDNHGSSELCEEVKIKKRIKPKLSRKFTTNKLDKIADGYKLIQIKSIDRNSSVYTCNKCLTQFKNRDAIKEHIFVHHTEFAAYKCQVCLKVYLSKKSYTSHSKLHKNPNDITNIIKVPKLQPGAPDTKQGQVQCEFCPKKLLNHTTWKNHMKFHNGTNRPELCELCGRVLSDINNLRMHIRTVHEKLRFGCDICGRNFASKKSMKQHILAHMFGAEIIKPHQCDKCAKRFNYPITLKRHQLRRHERKYPCRVCKLVFDTLALYKQHKHYKTERKYCCDICNKEYLSSFALRRHIDAHNNIRRFPCDKCPLKFIDKSQLQRHVGRIHNPDHPASRKVLCLICKHHFNDINKHMPTHTNKKYSCTYCQSAYSLQRSLKRHLDVMHVNDLQFKCELCNKRFISLKSLDRHKSRVHKVFKSERGNDSVSELNNEMCIDPIK